SRLPLLRELYVALDHRQGLPRTERPEPDAPGGAGHRQRNRSVQRPHRAAGAGGTRAWARLVSVRRGGDARPARLPALHRGRGGPAILVGLGGRRISAATRARSADAEGRFLLLQV